MSDTHKKAITNFVNDMRKQAIADLSEQTSFQQEEEFVRERMIEAWTAGHFTGHMEGYTQSHHKAMTTMQETTQRMEHLMSQMQNSKP